MEISHLALWIKNKEATLDLYGTTLGLSCAHHLVDESGIENIYLTDGTTREVQFKYDPAQPELTGPPAVVDHIAFVVPEVDVLTDTVRNRTGCKIIKGPWTRVTRRGYHARLAIIEDPNGYHVELIEKLDE